MSIRATTRAYSATASTRAKPTHIGSCTTGCAAGLRASEAIVVAKMLPIPAPTPPRPTTAMPAPIIFAASTSIVSFPIHGLRHLRCQGGPRRSPVLPSLPLVHVQGVVEVDTRQD